MNTLRRTIRGLITGLMGGGEIAIATKLVYDFAYY